MQFVCDAPGNTTWFRIETEAEALHESADMHHTVEKYFRRERDKAIQSYKPASQHVIERDIGLSAHIAHSMAMFLTLRDREGTALVTAMLPPVARNEPSFRIIIVGRSNADPYPTHGNAIAALAVHTGLTLDRENCFPYGRSVGG